MERFISLIGVFVFLGIAAALSQNRKKISIRLVASTLCLQVFLGIIVLWTKPGHVLFESANNAILKILQFSNAGSEMVFGLSFRDHFFAFAVLPSIIFFSSLMAILFHLGIMQRLIWIFSWLMTRVLKISGPESMVASANIFVGGIESTLTVRPYLDKTTQSELFTMQVAGFSTIAGGVMAAFSGFGINAGHLLSAQILSAVGAIAISKIMLPETQEFQRDIKLHQGQTESNLIEAACRGAADGLKISATIAAMLIAFVALTAMLNFFIHLLPFVASEPLSMERLLGWVFRPIVFLTGSSWHDSQNLGMLLGKKMFLNEFIAFLNLNEIKAQISDRSFTLATYFLCGFANFSAVAMQIGGMGSIIPARKSEIAKTALTCMIGGTLTSLLSASIAGLLMP